MKDKFYLSAELQSKEFDNCSIGYRQFGNGKDILMIHGFPTHGYTWRKIIPKISEKYKCHVLDLPGLGDSKWTKKTNFSSQSHANRIIQYIDEINIDKCSLIAHNSGATIARVIAIYRPKLIDKLILINTELPNHRPPWIPFYQKTGLLPLVPEIIRIALKQKWFINSAMGFKEAYSDKSMLKNPDNLNPYIKPIISSKARIIGAFKYLQGIDWKLIDGFQNNHKKIKAKTLFVWGEDDKTFPIKYAKSMMEQFNNNCEFKAIRNASLLPHEEKSEEVSKDIIEFLENK